MNVGVVFAGGMAKGAYQIGAMKALSEYYKPGELRFISAASVGVLNAYAFAAGRIDLAYKLWKNLFKQSDKIFITAVAKSDYLRTAIEKMSALKPKCDKLYAPIFNIPTRSNCYTDVIGHTRERTAELLKASVAVFPFCKPIKSDDKYYLDGAIIDDIPVYPLMKHPRDYVICIYYDEYNYMFESEQFDGKIIKISLYDREEVLRQSIWFTKEDTERMARDGYKETKAVREFVFSKGMDDPETIRSQIEMLNALNPKREIRLTGDIAVSRINKFLKTLTKRKIID